MRWRWGVVGCLAGASAAVSVLMWEHHRADLAVVWTVVAGFVAVMAVAVPWARSGASRERQVTVPAGVLTDAARGLASAVQQQWQAESSLRRIQDPWPLPVRWVNTVCPVMDYWAAVRGVPGEDAPLDLSGELNGIAEVYARIPSGRLVVLGEGGAGKTVLLIQLVLGLLESWTVNDPVPVLVSVASWDTAVPLNSWLVSRLGEEYPWLAAPASSGMTLAWELVGGGRVLPVLDGLDEIPRGLRANAIGALNLALTRWDRVIVSCRSGEYQEAVESGDVLSRAAVVELSPLPVDELRKYLRVTTPPGRAAVWERVFAVMAAEQDGPLARALSTPLMAWLARIGYGETTQSPDELLSVNADGVRVFGSRSAIEERLLDRYIPAVYSASGEHSSVFPVSAAQRWLSFLAVHMNRLGTRDLAWWQLPDGVSSFWPVIGLISGLAVGLVLGLASRFAGSLLVELAIGLGAGAVGTVITGTRAEIRAKLGVRYLDGLRSVHGEQVAVGVLGGLGAGVTAGLVAGPAAGIMASVITGLLLGLGSALASAATALGFPPPVAVQFKGRVRQIARRFAYGAIAGGAIGIALAITIDFTITTATGLTTLVFGSAAGIAGGLVLGFLEVLSVPNDPGLSRSPFTVLRQDRGATAAASLVAMLAAGGAAGTAFGLISGPMNGVVFGLAVGLTGSLAVSLGGGLGGAWGRFTVARIALALTGRTSWRLMAFLEDAHRRGILRQVGGVYQFRHSRLQDRLVANEAADARPTTLR